MIPLLLLSIPVPLEDLELFEAEVRPLLVERCYRCHNSVDRREAGLAVDHAAGLLAGGDSGPAIVPGDPDASLLLHAVRHAEAPRMPREEPRLEPDELRALERWIASGAPDPRDDVPTAEELAAETAWEVVRERRTEWWSYRPIEDPPVPEVEDEAWPRDDLDRFVLARLEAASESPAPALGRETLLRRASFVLTGLPPTPEARAAFLADDAPGAYGRAVDRLLASPHHAERLARHWMDLVRYAESHGSEGDPAVPNAWRYRDYLVRAFEADVPWDRLVMEHVAGDRLPPRVDPREGIDASQVALAHWRFVLHGYAPVEPLEEQVRFLDDQMKVLGKAFLGQTISCARCHDHKFDPIGQDDYHALYGVLASKRPAQRTVDSRERRTREVAELRAAKPAIRTCLAGAWRAALPDLPARLAEGGPALAEAEADPAHPLHPWVRVHAAEDLRAEWDALRAEYAASATRLEEAARAAEPAWDLAGDDARRWFAHGSVLDTTPARPGAFAVLPAGERVLATVLPGGIYSHLVSSKHSGVLTSPNLDVRAGHLFVRVMGGGGARVRYAMEHYPRAIGPIYPAHDSDDGRPRWRSWDMEYWAGDRAYLEVATARDLPVDARGQERSWWGLTEARFVPAGAPHPRDEAVEFQAPLMEQDVRPGSVEELATAYVRALEGVLERWERDACSDADARFLDPFVRHGLLPVTLDELPAVAPMVEAYREREARVPVPIRAPGVIEGPSVDMPLLERGDFRRPTEPVPRRFLAWLDDEPYGADGRLELARDLVRPDNPLTPRVAVNRMWTWVFGEGLVPTVDNLGRLGREPTHPELLDHLATRFVQDDWSVRRLLRALVTSSTFRQRRTALRLDAESIRDALLAVSGRLDRRRFGPSVDERTARRSLYVAQRRGSPPAFLATFDQPPPHTTLGRRPVTNVPAQGLALLNDPLVVECARAWAGRHRELEDAERVETMFVEALGRAPAADELSAALRFLETVRKRQAEARRERAELDEEIAGAEARRASLLEAGRARALAARGDAPASGSGLPEPYARWEFEGGLTDEQGHLHGHAHGAARVEDGRLVLGGGAVLTEPLPTEVRAKTLEAWVALADLEQRGAGVITLQGTDGGLFDSIVFAEREPRRWMAGSDLFRRTEDVNGVDETSTKTVHVAIAYAGDGTITVYRDGEPYGRPYRSSGPARFAACESQVLLGARHGTASTLRTPLHGALERAALYDRALTPEEVAASAAGDPSFVPHAEAVAALDEADRDELARVERGLEADRGRLEELTPTLAARPWTELAHALFQLEEFRYLR